MLTATTEVRWMIRSDLDQVLAIERTSFDHPWEERHFMTALRQRNCIGKVAERRNEAGQREVVGFVLYELHANRLEVLNIAVHASHRRTGVGSSLLIDLQGRLGVKRRQVLSTVRESNLRAQQFFRSHKFRCVEQMRNYFTESHEDAYRFRYRLTHGGT